MLCPSAAGCPPLVGAPSWDVNTEPCHLSKAWGLGNVARHRYNRVFNRLAIFMTSAWLLPEHLSDILPSEARRIEELRRSMLDTARGFAYELVMPPLLEYLESLLSGTGQDQSLRTFKLVDQLSGKTMGVRADTTPQVARIDAHLLNREGVTRLAYCGPVLHTEPLSAMASREPLQLGAEIYGHQGIEADLEIQELALECLDQAGVQGLVLDLSDARVVQSVLARAGLSSAQRDEVLAAMAAKDQAALEALRPVLPPLVMGQLEALLGLYGGEEVLVQAQTLLEPDAGIAAALADLRTVAQALSHAHPEVRIRFDLGDSSGCRYYTGLRFAVYVPGHVDAVLRGGRYDEVGSVFGRRRPAVGFSTDLKQLVRAQSREGLRKAIRAPWGQAEGLRGAVRDLRRQGETVVCVLPGHEHEVTEFECDRELREVAGQWIVAAIA